MKKKHSLRSGRRRQRRGGAVVELVVCIPVIALLVFASIEACSMIFVRQSMHASAYEGVRVAVRDDATTSEAEQRCTSVLNLRKVDQASIVFDPADISGVKPGDPITVTITAPCDANSIMPPWFFGGRTLTVTTTMVKE